MPERLSINSEMFATMREQFDVILNSLTEQLSATDEAELSVKIKLRKEFTYEWNEDGLEEVEKQKIKASWDIVRTIKAKKYKVEGTLTEDFFLDKDEDGKLILRKVEQISMFDNLGNEIAKL